MSFLCTKLPRHNAWNRDKLKGARLMIAKRWCASTNSRLQAIRCVNWAFVVFWLGYVSLIFGIVSSLSQ